MSSPAAPTITNAVVGNQTMSVYFTQGDLGGGNVVKYMYSLNGSEYVDATEMSSPIIISGLTNGTTYSVRLIVETDAATANFSSPSDILSDLIPYTSPDAPSISSITLGDGYMSILFADGASNGGYALSGYKYSIDAGVSYTDIELTGNPVVLTELTNGTLYIVSVKAVSSAPTNNISEASPSLNAIPYTAPDAPIITSIDPSNNCLIVNVINGESNGGYALSGYKYSIDGGDTFLEADESVSPIIIKGLTNHNLYSVSIKSVSSALTNNISEASNTVNAIPYMIPQSPIINKIDGSNQMLTIYYTDRDTGGYQIKKRQYTINGGNTYIDCPHLISPEIKTDFLDETTFKIGNASLKSTNKSDISFFPISETIASDGTFTLTGQSDSIKNGTYKITASSYYNGQYGNYPPKNLLDSNISTLWSADWSSSTHRYLGNGNGTYTGSVITNVVNVGDVGGEWFQIQFPNPIEMSTYTLKTYENMYERYPKEFYIVGSNNGTIWNQIDRQTNQIITNYNPITYTVNSTNSYLYIRFIFVSMPNGYSGSNDFNLASFKLTSKVPSEYAVLPNITTTSVATSISTWIKTTSTSKVIMDLANNGNVDNIKLMINEFGHLTLYVENGGLSNTVELTSTSIATNAWTHIVINIENVNGSAKYTSFINGVQTIVSSNNIYPAAILRTSNYIFKSNNTDLAINGNIDDVRIYGRSLSINEVQSLFTYKNQTDFPLNTDTSLLVYNPLDYVNDVFTINGLTNGTEYPINMRSITYAPSDNISLMSDNSFGIPYTIPSTPVITGVIPVVNGCDVSFSLANNGGYPIVKYQYMIDELEYIDIYETTSPLHIRGLPEGQIYSIRIRAISSAPLNNVSQESNLVSNVIYYTEPSAPIVVIESSGNALIVNYTIEDTGGYDISNVEYKINNGSFITVPYTRNLSYLSTSDKKIGNASYKNNEVAMQLFPQSANTPNFTISVSSWFDLYPLSWLVDGNFDTGWRNNDGSPATRYEGLGGGTYTGSNYTTVQSIGNVYGEWCQFSFDTPFIVSDYGVGAGSNLSQFPNGFYLLGSNDNSTWVVLDSRTNQTASLGGYRVYTYNTTNKYKCKYIRFIMTKLNGENRGFLLTEFRIGALIDSLNPHYLPPITTPTESMSISAWIKTQNQNGAFLKIADNVNKGINLKINEGKIHATVITEDSSMNAAISNSTINTNTWNHFVCNISNTGTWDVYINGTIDKSNSGLFPTSQLYQLNVLGTADISNIFYGGIDDVRIYGKLLTTSEIKSLYKYQNTTLFPLNNDSDLILRESFDRYNASPFIIDGLTNGTTYTINMRSISYAPTNNISNSATITGMPTGSPEPPTFYIDGSNQKMVVNYTEPAITGGYPIIKYLYNIDGGEWLEMSDTTGYYEITTTDGTTPLVNGTMYEVKMRSVSAHPLPEMATSVDSDSVFNIPYTSPTSPTILKINPSDKELIVEYSPSTYNGGYPISAYEYSTNGTTYTTVQNNTYSPDYTKYNITGSWITLGGPATILNVFDLCGMNVYACYDNGATKMVTVSGIQKYYNGPIANFNVNNWNTYLNLPIPNGYILNLLLPITGVNSPILDTSIKQVGTSSLFLNSTLNQYGTIPVDYVLSPDGFSMSFWIRPNIASMTEKVFIFETTGNYTNLNAMSIYLDTDGSLKMSTNPNGTVNTYTLFSDNLNNQSWTHIAVTINRYKRLKSYINNVLTLTTTCEINNSYHKTIYVGKTGSSSVLYHGHIDDFRIYNGKLLSGNEIGLLYNYVSDLNFSLNKDPKMISYSTFDQTYQNTFSISGLTNGTSRTVSMRAKTNAPVNKYSLIDSSSAKPFSAPVPPILDPSASETGITIKFAQNSNTSGYTISKYQYSFEDGPLIDISLNGPNVRLTDLIFGNKYDIFLHTVSNAPYNNISTATYKNIGTHIAPSPPTITSIDPSNSSLLVTYAGFTGYTGYDVSGYQYSINNGVNWVDASVNATLITGLTNGTQYTVIMRTVSKAPTLYLSPASDGVTATPYTKPNAPTILSVDNNGTTLDVYYQQIETNGGYSINYYELSFDNGEYINIGTQLPYAVNASSLIPGSYHTVKMRSISNAPSNSISSTSSVYTVRYIGANIPAPIITSADISNGSMNIYYTQDPYVIPTQKYIYTEDEINYNEITELITTGSYIPNALDVDPALHFYYTFDSNSYNGTQLGNKASGSYVYDATLSANGLIGTSDKKYGTGSLQLSGGLKYATLPAFNIGTNGYTISIWFKNNGSSIWARAFDLGAAYGTAGNTLTLACYYNSFAFGRGGSTGIFNPNVNVNDNTWRHYVMTCSASGRYRFYLDNVMLQETQAAYLSITQFNSNYIGYSNDPPSYEINGGIDEFRLYKRELTATEVGQLYSYTPSIDTRKQLIQYDLTNPLTISDLVNGRGYTLKIQSVLDTSNSVALTNSNFSDGTASWTMDGSYASISSVEFSTIRESNGIDSSNALSVKQSKYGTTVLYQPVNVYGAGKYILKVAAAASSTYDASQTLQIGIDGNYSTPINMSNSWKNYIHLVDIPESMSNKQIQLKVTNLNKIINNSAINNNSSSFKVLASTKIPWAMYSAEDYNPTTNIISEMRGYDRDAVVSGTGAVFSIQSGNGTNVAIPQITGTTSTKITFPTGSIPSTFTICAITRFAGPSRGRVLQSTAGNFWFLGHRAGVKACASFDQWMTANGSSDNVENWQVICGKNSAYAANNILVDGNAVGSYDGGTGGYTLCINDSPSGELSDFGFSHVFIWDQTLTDSEMQAVTYALMVHLHSGVSFKPEFTSGSVVGITNVSLSKAFVSPLSNSSDYIIPYTAPLPPVINTLDVSNSTLTVSYSDTTDNGGYSITKYQYSLNSAAYVDVAVGTNTFTISGLTNGTSYSIVMRSVSSAPNNNFSSNSLSKTGTPYSRASPLTITSIDASNTILYVNFTTADTGGSSLIRYEYSINSGTYIAASQMSSPLTIAGLTNGTSYSVKIRQITTAPINPDSPDSNTISSIPFKQPLPPTIVSLDASNQRLVLTYTNSTNNGGYSITKYQYKINGGTYTDVAVGTNIVYLDGLTNGTAYSVSMRTISTAPFSNISVDSSTITTTPYARPSPLVITSIDASSTALFVNFTAASNGGYSLVRYEYSLNAGSYIAATEMSSPIKITGLTNATSYSVKIRQVTSAPAMNSSVDSNSITETPYNVPSAPVITSLVPGNKQITVNYNIPAANGRPITSYKYSLNNGSLIDISSSTPIIITGLINSYSYDVRIYAINFAGASLASNMINSIPFSVPTAPTIVNAVPGDRTVTITFTPPTDVGGYAILGYKYAFGLGAFTTYTDTMSGHKMTFNNLINGSSYALRIKAFNIKGDSPASNISAFIPNANPATPTIAGAVPTMTGAILKYSDGVGSALISGYKYTLDSRSFLDLSINLTGAIINNLTPGLKYRVKMRAFNPLFDSSDSNVFTIFPGAPDTPTITNITLSGKNASIYFTQAITDCPNPHRYYVLNNGETIFTTTETTSPILLPNLKYGTSYNLKLRALNQYHLSYLSNGFNLNVGGAVPDKINKVLVTPLRSFAIVRIPYIYSNSSAITTIKYSLNNGDYVDLGGYYPIFKISNIESNVEYSIKVIATNSYGDSIPSNAVTFSNVYTAVPDQPRISNMTIDLSGTLKIFIDQPVSSIIPIQYYKYKLIRNYVEDENWTIVSTANRIITIPASVNVVYTAKVMAVNLIGSSIASSYWASNVKYTLSIASTPNIDGIYNTYDGNLSLFFTIQTTGGAPITDMLYSIDNGETYTSSGARSQPIIISGLENNKEHTFRIKAVTVAGTTGQSKPLTFVKQYKVPSRPYITRLNTTGTVTRVRLLIQNNGGSPITGYKYTIDGGASVSVSLNADKEFTIMNLSSGAHTINVYATNAVGDSLATIKNIIV